jgi:outer membrane protein TolC
MRTRLITLALLVLPLAAPAQGRQDQQPKPEKPPPRYSLAALIERTVKASPEIEKAAAGLEAARGKQDQAKGARWPQIQATGLFGPSPRARGTVVASPDSKTSPTIDGVFARIDFTAIQPLFTFGKISSLGQAAAAGVAVDLARIDEARGTVVLRTKEMYYGKLLTGDLLGLIEDISDGINKSLERLVARTKPKDLDQAGDEANPEANRLRSYLAIAGTQRAEVVKNQQLATAALRAFARLPPEDPVELDAEGIAPPEVPAESEAESIGAALALRPEMRQAKAGVLATAALARAERANLFPHFFLGLTGFAATATNRDYQKNPFVYDPMEDRVIGAGLGARYQLDFGITRGRIREAQAENKRIEALRHLADVGIPVEVVAARQELTAALDTVRVTEAGGKSARRWLVVAQSNYDLGLADVKDLGDAVETYAKLRSDYLMALYRANVALARLAHVTGRDDAPVAPARTEQ